MKRLFKFNWDCGRMGEVEGLFIAEESAVKKAIGRKVYFGEILGKHSEVWGALDKNDVKALNIPSDVVLLLEKEIGETISGYNPLDYLGEIDEDEVE